MNDFGQPTELKPVIRVQGEDTDSGGLIELRSFGANVRILGSTQVFADNISFGPDGTIHIKSCTGFALFGTVDPADLDSSDDTGLCTIVGP